MLSNWLRRRKRHDHDSGMLGLVAPRTCTLLFTDLVGSTALRTRLGDEVFDQRRRRHDRLLGDAISLHSGELIKHEGDGAMAMFASAADAIACAVTIQQAIARE